jgi:hypothetical protein
MPKTSKDTATGLTDVGLAEDRSENLDGYAVDFVTIRETHDLRQALAGLPDGMCPCPHWGYLFTGRLTVRYGDREEVIEAGDAYYLSPGHVPAAEAGSEFIQFSPADQLAAVNAAMRVAMGR